MCAPLTHYSLETCLAFWCCKRWATTRRRRPADSFLPSTKLQNVRKRRSLVIREHATLPADIWELGLLSMGNLDISNTYVDLSLVSSVGIATGYGLDDREDVFRVPVESRIFSSESRPDRLWGPPNLLSNRYWGLFRRDKAAETRSWPLTSI
jgi:hypothetical protein